MEQRFVFRRNNIAVGTLAEARRNEPNDLLRDGIAAGIADPGDHAQRHVARLRAAGRNTAKHSKSESTVGPRKKDPRFRAAVLVEIGAQTP